MNKPLVTVLCLCYNQGRFVEEAIQSVLTQSYPAVQLIILDDGSSDDSVSIIEKCIGDRSDIIFIINKTNQGYTRALNQALTYAKGEFIIDLAADDVLMANRVEEGVLALSSTGEKYGVNFSDAILIDEMGKEVAKHSDRFPHHSILQGDVYRSIIEKYFICPPTMMFRKTVIDTLGGYDETLAYEDFDFFVRASRNYLFCYTPQVLVKKRLLSNSMASRQFKGDMLQRWSTLRVCEKINALNKTEEEGNSLRRRIWYEIVVSLRRAEFKLAWEFGKLYFRLSSPSTILT
jgi:glycosyltransferase involved in cell wall biosynthesis